VEVGLLEILLDRVPGNRDSRLGHGNSFVGASDPNGLTNRKQRGDGLGDCESSNGLVLAKKRYRKLQRRSFEGPANRHDIAEKISEMQVPSESPELRKVIGLHSPPMLFRGLDRELAHARERACGGVRGLLDLLERDPPDRGGAGSVGGLPSILGRGDSSSQDHPFQDRIEFVLVTRSDHTFRQTPG